VVAHCKLFVPADKKWYRNYFVARTLVERLGEHEREWIKELKARGRQELAEVRKTDAPA
jgi:hypothetical protein